MNNTMVRQSTYYLIAVWDGDLRLPGVTLEKRRANRIYSEIKSRMTDPGLLQQDDERGGTSAFSARVFPIPAYGSKRVELGDTETLPVENLTSRFSFPLRPSFGPPQRVGELRINVQALSDSPISPLNFNSTAYAMKAVKTGPNELQYEFLARNVELREDLSFDYAINVPQSASRGSLTARPNGSRLRRKPALSIEFNERAVTQSLQ